MFVEGSPAHMQYERHRRERRERRPPVLIHVKEWHVVERITVFQMIGLRGQEGCPTIEESSWLPASHQREWLNH